MGWYTSPTFGDGANQYCPDQCQHRDCAKARQDVASLCRICQKPIGGGVPIYFESDGIVHRDCAWAEMESHGPAVESDGLMEQVEREAAQ